MKAVTVVEYDPRWPRLFEQLAKPIGTALAGIAHTIEHVGSTAVPGLAAKPVVDIDIIVSGADIPPAIARLEALGYAHAGDQGIPQREAFKRPPGTAPHHVYLCPVGSPALANHLAVRDYLRATPAAVRSYSNLKKRLAAAYPHDIDAYIEAKTPFLLEILRIQGFAQSELEAVDAMNRRLP